MTEDKKGEENRHEKCGVPLWKSRISLKFRQAKKAGSPAFLSVLQLEAAVTAAVAVVSTAAAQEQQDDPDVLTSATAAVSAKEASTVSATAAQK